MSCELCDKVFGTSDKSFEIVNKIGSNFLKKRMSNSVAEMMVKGYNDNGYNVTKTFTCCYDCFVSKYNPVDADAWYCPSCRNECWHSNKGTTRHQVSCANKKCKKLVCEVADGWKKIYRFCDYCRNCCQKLKIDCDICCEKMDKRYCNMHTGNRGTSDFRCKETHCRKCCKMAHLCFICKGTSNERFKFDWKGTFHSSCLKGKTKLTCTMCDKSYRVSNFYDGWFVPAICKHCLPEAVCAGGCHQKVKSAGINSFSKWGESLECLICDDCREKRNVGMGCGDGDGDGVGMETEWL